jgi:hypothetical protein
MQPIATARVPFGRRLRGPVQIVGLIIGCVVVAAGLCVTIVGPWQRRWGATDAEIARGMPGDDLISKPLHCTTRAVTVDTAPEYIWPWLVQMGNGRGGLYSYDWIDLLIGAIDQPSVSRVLPEYQNLHVGDVMPYAKGSNFVVRVLEANRFLVIQLSLPDETNVVQSWGLYSMDATHTRLVLRVRAAFKITALRLPLMTILDPAEGVMVRKQLLGIKRRAEVVRATVSQTKSGMAANTASIT